MNREYTSMLWIFFSFFLPSQSNFANWVSYSLISCENLAENFMFIFIFICLWIMFHHKVCYFLVWLWSM
jgi:hypothetical protein